MKDANTNTNSNSESMREFIIEQQLIYTLRTYVSFLFILILVFAIHPICSITRTQNNSNGIDSIKQKISIERNVAQQNSRVHIFYESEQTDSQKTNNILHLNSQVLHKQIQVNECTSDVFTADNIDMLRSCSFYIKLIIMSILIRIICMFFRALNYLDLAKKYGVDSKGFLRRSWYKAFKGCYYVPFEDKKWIEPVIETNFVISNNESHWEIRRTNKFTIDSSLRNDYRWYAYSIYPLIIGLLELIAFSLFLNSHHIDYIGWTFSILTIAQWNSWKENRAVFYTFLIGTVLNIIGSYIIVFI